MLKKGDILDERYLIDDVIGSGGTSTVFKAFDLNADKSERAVKEIHGSDEEIQEKIAESVLMAELSKSNTRYNFIPNIIHRVRKGNALFIVMDYINGTDMSEILSEHAPLPHNKVIEYARDICNFMIFLHEKHFLYSDMKPENIMILKNDETGNSINNARQYSSLKFVDFGATIAEGNETIAFTPSYAAPEQFLGQFDMLLPDKRTDIFNTGATIFHMITGYAPENVFRTNGETKEDLRPSHERFIFPAKSGISKGLKRIILKCVSDDSSQRYSSCSEIITELEKLSERKHVILSAVLAGISVLLALAGTISLIKCSSAKDLLYSEYIEQADTASDPEEKIDSYLNAIKIRPDNQEGYLRLIDACRYDRNSSDKTDDMYFTDTEKKKIQEAVASNQRYLVKNGSFGKIEYEIGRLIWYFGTENSETKSYAETERTKMKAALSYFEEAINIQNNSGLSEKEEKLAGIYYHMADFCLNYQKRIENGDRNEPVSLADLRFMTDSVSGADSDDCIRLETYYSVIDILDESSIYYDDSTLAQLPEFYDYLYTCIHNCGNSGIPYADIDLKASVSELCKKKISEFR